MMKYMLPISVLMLVGLLVVVGYQDYEQSNQGYIEKGQYCLHGNPNMPVSVLSGKIEYTKVEALFQSGITEWVSVDVLDKCKV